MNQKHKHSEAMIAFANGVKIQFRTIQSIPWQDWTDVTAPNFHENFFYRVKPIVADKHQKVFEAFEDGEKIEFRQNNLQPWADATTPSWDNKIEYRIKPKVAAKHLGVYNAFYDGAKVQWRPLEAFKWADIDYPHFVPTDFYRIKPVVPVKHQAVFDAWEKGAKIEFFGPSTKEWLDLGDKVDTFYEDLEYRIKLDKGYKVDDSVITKIIADRGGNPESPTLYDIAVDVAREEFKANTKEIAKTVTIKVGPGGSGGGSIGNSSPLGIASGGGTWTNPYTVFDCRCIPLPLVTDSIDSGAVPKSDYDTTSRPFGKTRFIGVDFGMTKDELGFWFGTTKEEDKKAAEFFGATEFLPRHNTMLDLMKAFPAGVWIDEVTKLNTEGIKKANSITAATSNSFDGMSTAQIYESIRKTREMLLHKSKQEEAAISKAVDALNKQAGIKTKPVQFFESSLTIQDFPGFAPSVSMNNQWFTSGGGFNGHTPTSYACFEITGRRDAAAIVKAIGTAAIRKAYEEGKISPTDMVKDKRVVSGELLAVGLAVKEQLSRIVLASGPADVMSRIAALDIPGIVAKVSAK